jgi:hypothetical protein
MLTIWFIGMMTTDGLLAFHVNRWIPGLILGLTIAYELGLAHLTLNPRGPNPDPSSHPSSVLTSRDLW